MKESFNTGAFQINTPQNQSFINNINHSNLKTWQKTQVA